MDAVFSNVTKLFGELTPDPDRPDTIDSGDPEMWVGSLTEGAIESGVWTCSVGGWPETDYAVNEVMVMVDGRLRITNADGTTHELTEGDMFFLPKGWSGRWDVLEDMKKIYFIVE
jgi:uncharacterized cupin superfamily protein